MRPYRRIPADADGERPSLAERLRALRLVPHFLKLVWEAHPGYATAIVLLRIAQAFGPLALLWVGKLIIDAVVANIAAPSPDWAHLARLVGLELGIALALDAMQRLSALLESLLGDLFSNRLSVRLMEHAATLDLEHFEDPEFYDHLERARRQTVGRIGLVALLLGMAQSALTLASLMAALIAFNGWLLVLLALAVLPSFLGETHYAGLSYSLLYQWTPERRQLDYLRYVASSDATAKEVKLFGLSRHFVQRYATLADEFYRANRALAVRRAAVGGALTALSSVVYYGAYGFIIWQTVLGVLTVGTLTFLAGSFMRSRDLIARLLLGSADVYEQSLFLRDLFAFLEMRPRIASRNGARPVPSPIREGFVFDDVGFRYPGSERWALRHVSFTLRPGERIALVGENGAGKTTLVKLLARLYDPTEGRILLDGVDLREYDVDSLRRIIGVIFQDFVRYDMIARENIAIGRIDALEDRPRIESAAAKSLADGVIARLERGYDHMLGRRFEGGANLSGGEWQKIALARAYMRDAEVLILDEPTAALDARAEYEVFQRFSELTAGKMAVLISHRFSTVRMADRILVLEGGTVIEQGSHAELVARGGKYAELFTLQAAGYR
ncbi:MAG TPA: ABC transporter ATP-binding protein [Longimicrobiales bacterium]|nr:ABC transporter ATP-binding protein [Longimicrobiales bacterium]